jgi:hypothetical protein
MSGVITWDASTLYDAPTVGTCAVTGAFETGRWFLRDGKRIFVGETAQPEAVEDYVGFRTALGTVGGFKRGYPKTEWTAARLGSRKPARKAGG